MEWIFMLLCILSFILGLLLGSHRTKTLPVGTLRIDHSEPDEAPLLFLELSTDPRYIMREKQVVLDISTESYLSQK